MNTASLTTVPQHMSNEEVQRYCAGCGEFEGSDYAKHCCTDDNMLEA